MTRKRARLRKTDSLTVAVLSDSHAYDLTATGAPPPSYLCVKDPETPANQHPFASLMDLIAERDLRADLLICCGDMGDKASPSGIKYVWDKLQVVKQTLRSDFLAATCGNHDVDSRFQYTDFDAKGFLQSLMPPFPFEEENLNDKFWARNYAIVTKENYRLLVLNSSAYHGFYYDNEKENHEFEHGRISDRTVESIRAELELLEKTSPRMVNILLCHHHPHKHDDIDDADYSVMSGAPKLMRTLDSGNFGNWIIIHGHKHQPALCYSAGGSSAPIVFSAGSFSAVPYPDIQAEVRNQFYLIEFPLSQLMTLGLGLVGTFRTWDWSKGKGWLDASPHSGLPARGGFGNRHDRTAVANAVAGIVKKAPQPYLQWKEIVATLPGLSYVLPGNLENVLRLLENNHTLHVVRGIDGLPVQIEK